jgi:hypothetical protein
MRWQNDVRRYCLGALLIVCATGFAQAQQTVNSATLSGRVADATGAVIKGASVTVRNLETNFKCTCASDDDGVFQFPYLTVGSYALDVNAHGFTELQKQLTLTIGEALEVYLKLPVAGVTETVAVSSELPVLETGRTQLAEPVLMKEIDSLPLNGRNYLDLAALTPGVSRSNPVANQRFPETSAVPGTGLSITGQRSINNGFVVDGLSANDDAADLPGTFYSQEVIREFEVITSGGIAQFGRASGGFVNIITKSGTNNYRGRLYGFFRNQRFDARNPLAATKDPLTQAQYGVSFGGPIIKNRTFFFTNFEQTRLHNAAVITISEANLATVNSHLDAVRYGSSRLSTGIAPTGFNATNFLFRLDHQLNNSNQLSARYGLYEINSANSRNVGGLNAISRGTPLNDRDQSLAVGEVAALSPQTVNELRFQYTRSRLHAPPNDSTGPAVNVSGVANFGTATFSPTQRDLDSVEIVETLSTLKGRHSLKSGADYLLNRVNIKFPGALQGVYTFSSMANFLADRYATFQQAFGAPSQFQSNPNVGLFVQDEWKPGPHLSINFGVRYDAQVLPAPIKTDTNNLAPRVGVSYAPGDRKTVVRASLGIFFDRLPLRATSNALQRDGTKYQVAIIPFGQTGAPVFPNTLAAFPANLLVSITTIDPRIQNAYSEQASVQVERELSSSTTLSVGYLHTRGLHLIVSRNLNVPTAAATAGISNLGRPDSRFANVNQFESSGDSYYNAMTVSLNRRFHRWFGLRASYTFAKSLDDAGGAFFFTPQDNNNLRGDLGLSDNDQRHSLTLSGTLEAPPGKSERPFRRALDGFQFSYIFRYSSRLPFNILTGNDRNLDTNVNDRPLGVARNTGRGFDFAALDLRISRTFRLTERVRLESLAEAFNVFNRANFQLPNPVFGTGSVPLPNFGAPTAAADPRQIQFGLRLSF